MKTYNQLICVSAAMLLVLIVVAQVQAQEPAADVPLDSPCATTPRPRTEVRAEAVQAVKDYRSTLSRSQDLLKN